MPGPVFIAGDSVDLRTVEAEDVAFLQEGMNRPAIRTYAGGDRPYNRPRYEQERFETASSGEVVHLVICAGDEPVGDVSLAPIDETRGWANLGYWIHPEHQGNGYATEAARLVVEHGFDELRLHRISAVVVEDNAGSERVLEKLGFTHEGTKRDDAFHDGEFVDRELYAVLGDEWSSSG